MKFQDYYSVLGLSRDATVDDIKKSYRKLALELHPDRQQAASAADRDAAEARFKRVGEAYEVLSDPETRRRYDRFGENWRDGEEFRPDAEDVRMSPEEFASNFGGSGFSDFFASLFGDRYERDFERGARPHARFRHRGADLEATLELGVGDAQPGAKRRVDLPVLATCHGCGGVGFLERHVCAVCGGIGRVHGRKSVDVTLPDKLRSGMRMRLAGLGEPGIDGGEAGDLYLTVRVQSDGIYRVSGNDLEVDLPVTPWEAVEGCKVGLRTPEGEVTVTVPRDSKSGRKLRLAGRGLHDGKGGRGDLIAVVRLALPEDLNDEQRRLLAEIAAAGPADVRGGARAGSRS